MRLKKVEAILESAYHDGYATGVKLGNEVPCNIWYTGPLSWYRTRLYEQGFAEGERDRSRAIALHVNHKEATDGQSTSEESATDRDASSE